MPPSPHKKTAFSSDSVQEEKTQDASPEINVGANPVDALAQFEEQPKSFPDPVFSPEIEEQVRAKAAAGKERNRIQLETLCREMEIDDNSHQEQNAEQELKNSSVLATLQLNQKTSSLSFSTSTFQPPLEAGIQPSKVFSPIILSPSKSNPVSDLNKKPAHNPALIRQSATKHAHFSASTPTTAVYPSSKKDNPASNPFNPCSYFDKQILLKKGAQRQHIHRYDLCLIIKTLKKDEDEEVRIQKTLQRFLDTMLRAVPSTLIPPYLELDRSDKNVPDLGNEKPVSDLEDYSDLKRYFSRLSARNTTTGKVYASVILAQNRPFCEVLDRTLSSLHNQEISIYTKATDHESPADVGWFLYSTRFQDDEQLTELLSQAAGEHVGVKWKQIRTTVGYQKPDPDNPVKQIKAFHVEGPSDKAHEIRSRLSRWYSSSSSEFLDGTKMRLIPPISNIFS